MNWWSSFVIRCNRHPDGRSLQNICPITRSMSNCTEKRALPASVVNTDYFCIFAFFVCFFVFPYSLTLIEWWGKCFVSFCNQTHAEIPCNLIHNYNNNAGQSWFDGETLYDVQAFNMLEMIDDQYITISSPNLKRTRTSVSTRLPPCPTQKKFPVVLWKQPEFSQQITARKIRKTRGGSTTAGKQLFSPARQIPQLFPGRLFSLMTFHQLQQNFPRLGYRCFQEKVAVRSIQLLVYAAPTLSTFKNMLFSHSYFTVSRVRAANIVRCPCSDSSHVTAA